MSVKHVQFALDGVPGLTATQRMVLVSLGEWANDDGICWPSHDRIATRTGVGRRQVMRIIDQLETMGVVEKVERKQYSNIYRIRCDIAMSDVTPASDVTFGASDVTSRTPDVTPVTGRCDIAMSPEPLRTTIEPPMKEPPELSRAKRPHRLPDDFTVTDELRSWARAKGMSDAQIDFETEKFETYWRGSGKAKSNWAQTWRNWMLTAIERSGGQHRNGRHESGDAALNYFLNQAKGLTT